MYDKLPPVLNEILTRLDSVFQQHTLRLNDAFNAIYEPLLAEARKIHGDDLTTDQKEECEAKAKIQTPEFTDFRHVIIEFMSGILFIEKEQWNTDLTIVSNAAELDRFSGQGIKQIQNGKSFYAITHEMLYSCRKSPQYQHGVRNFESFKELEPIMLELKSELEKLMTEKAIAIPIYGRGH